MCHSPVSLWWPDPRADGGGPGGTCPSGTGACPAGHTRTGCDGRSAVRCSHLSPVRWEGPSGQCMRLTSVQILFFVSSSYCIRVQTSDESYPRGFREYLFYKNHSRVNWTVSWCCCVKRQEGHILQKRPGCLFARWRMLSSNSPPL